MSRFTFQFFTPILLFFLMLVDGQVTQLLSSISGGTLTPVSHLLLIFMVYTVTQHRHSYVVIVALLIGMIYDSYYLGVFGVATLLFPLIVLFVYNIQMTVFTNRWTRLFTIIIIVTAFELASNLIIGIVGLSQFDLINFVVYQLAPTLLLNIVFSVVLQFPLEHFYKLTKSNVGHILKR